MVAEIIGYVCFILLLVCAICLLLAMIITLAKEIAYEVRLQRRFGKKPTALCHCRDCTEWDCRKRHCYLLDAYMEGQDFCKYASPKDREDEDSD